MPSFDLPALGALGGPEIERFRRDAFLVVERILSPDRVERLGASFPRLFAGQFDTGVYPDE